jgi:hypothetical protein
MTHDEWLSAVVLLSFATLVTVHVTLVAGLLARPPRLRALAALAVPPLAPYWGAREGMVLRTVVWAVAAIAYAVARWSASR